MQTGQHGLKRDLRLRDLVPMQIAIIVYVGWVGFAAKQGSTQVALWGIAILLFYAPLAIVVITLSRKIPVEGGVYQWVKQGASPFAGYLAAWNYSIYALFAFAGIGSVIAASFAYAAGPRGAWMGIETWFAVACTAVACVIAYVFNVRGVRVTTFWSNAGMVTSAICFGVLLYLLIQAWVRGAPVARQSFSLALPAFSLLTLNVLSKMCMGALSGFDSSGIFAEECRKPENDVAKSVMIAAPLIALVYILGTSSMLAYVTPAQANLTSPVTQVVELGFGVQGAGGAVTFLIAAMVSIAFIASMVIFVGAVSRLPMVAGWDGLLPAWWSKLHPRYRTPSRAIGIVVLVMLALSIFTLIGAGNEEALQVAVAASGGCMAVMYSVLFATALFGFRSREMRLGAAVRLVAAPALLVALVAFSLEAFPVGDVANVKIFGIKVVVSLICANALGAYLYWSGARRAAARANAAVLQT
jgi:glutamate:GABA antiporter